MAQTSPDDPAPAFDPSRYLTKVGSADYLEVKWRLVWLRDLAPDAEIETEAMRIDDSIAIFKARITLPTGGMATGYGSEAPGDFRDYIEKAETKAIGRALAALGFGTQFTPDFDFGAAQGRVVDTPIDFSSMRGRRFNDASADDASRRTASVSQPATPKQQKFIADIATELGLNEGELTTECEAAFGGKHLAALNRRDASAFIERLQARKAAGGLSDGAAAPPTEPATAIGGDHITPGPNLRRLHAIATERGLTHDELHAIAASRGAASLAALTAFQLAKFESWLERAAPETLRKALAVTGMPVKAEPPVDARQGRLSDDEIAAMAAHDASQAGADKWTR